MATPIKRVERGGIGPAPGPIKRRKARPISADVTANQLRGFVEISARGNSAEEVYFVDNLRGSTVPDRLANAIESAGIPHIGTFHPRLGVPLDSLRAELAGDPGSTNQKAFVTARYVLPAGPGGFDNDPDDVNAVPSIEIIASLEPVTTEVDVNRKKLEVTLNLDPPEGEEGPPFEDTQGGTVELLLPMHTVVARRRERESPGLVKSPRHTGTINGSVIFGDPKDRWLASIDGSSDDNGETYLVTYTFRRNPDTWNKVIAYRDKETGQVHPAVEWPKSMDPEERDARRRGNGAKVVRLFRRTEFRDLQLPIFGNV